MAKAIPKKIVTFDNGFSWYVEGNNSIAISGASVTEETDISNLTEPEIVTIKGKLGKSKELDKELAKVRSKT